MHYTEIKNKITALAGETPVNLICVSKYHTVEEIQAVYNLGQRDFGENKVQDLVQKAAVLPSDIRWHLLGHLQTNKVKQIVGKTTLIHSLDSLKLANEIQKHAERMGVTVDCLVQVNSTELEERYGVPYTELPSFIEAVGKLPNLRLKGMMGMAPLGEDPNPYFKKLHTAFSNSVLKNGILSMGMSGDFEAAIANGSTMVRIGRSIFE